MYTLVVADFAKEITISKECRSGCDRRFVFVCRVYVCVGRGTLMQQVVCIMSMLLFAVIIIVAVNVLWLLLALPSNITLM